jgi:hypothetical protein
MDCIKRISRMAVSALMLVAFAQPAGAVNLWNYGANNTGAVGSSSTAGGTVTYDGLNITATYCTAKVGGTNFSAAMGGCAALGLQFNVVTSGSSSSQVQIEITGAANSSSGTVTVNGSKYNSIFSTASTVTATNTTTHVANGGTTYAESTLSGGLLANDLTVYFTITDVSGTKPSVTSIGATLTGSDVGTAKSATEANDIGLAETYSSTAPVESGNVVSGTLGIGSVSGYSGTASASSGTLTSPSTNLQVLKDIKLAGAYNASDTLPLSDVTQTFTLKTPEPASFALLLVGLGGLAAARRYRRRDAIAGR